MRVRVRVGVPCVEYRDCEEYEMLMLHVTSLYSEYIQAEIDGIRRRSSFESLLSWTEYEELRFGINSSHILYIRGRDLLARITKNRSLVWCAKSSKMIENQVYAIVSSHLHGCTHATCKPEAECQCIRAGIREAVRQVCYVSLNGPCGVFSSLQNKNFYSMNLTSTVVGDVYRRQHIPLHVWHSMILAVVLGIEKNKCIDSHICNLNMDTFRYIAAACHSY